MKKDKGAYRTHPPGVRPCDRTSYRSQKVRVNLSRRTEDQAQRRTNLVHLADELVDVGFAVAEVTALNEVLELPCPPAASRVGEFKRPEEVVSLFEVGAGGEDLVDEIFDGEDVMLAKGLLNDLVVGKRNTLFVGLAIAALVNQLTDGLQVRLATGKMSLLKLL